MPQLSYFSQSGFASAVREQFPKGSCTYSPLIALCPSSNCIVTAALPRKRAARVSPPIDLPPRRQGLMYA
jgi:hypothetical protein